MSCYKKVKLNSKIRDVGRWKQYLETLYQEEKQPVSMLIIIPICKEK
jgi:hypothetical protein